MKKFIVLLCLVIIIFLYFANSVFRTETDYSTKKFIPAPTQVASGNLTHEENILFVPYWTFGSTIEDSEYDEIVYFGVTADKDGIDTSDDGYKKLDDFILYTDSGKKRLLAVRMIDFDINSYVLKKKNLQEKIIKQAVRLASDNSFAGIVLDFEINGIPFDSFVNSITDFHLAFAKDVKQNNLIFYTTIYGDAFYRIRPYDIEKIAGVTDAIIIMAYDFHKAKGNPGPNFPLDGKDKYNYSLKEMIADFTRIIPKEKLVITFGLYGYDWTLNDKYNSVSTAKSLSFNKIKNNFIDNCQNKKCTITRDNESAESNISYIDEDNRKHIIWFEDITSMQRKKQFLNESGIYRHGVWAYSYY